MSVYHNYRFNLWIVTVEVDGKVLRGAYGSEDMANLAVLNKSVSLDAEHEYERTEGSFCGFLPFLHA
jgi:hypothetical protein